MIRFAFCISLLAAPAAAQDWQTFAAGSRIGAGICPRAMSHADDGTFCLSVVCDGGEGPFLDLSFLGFGSLPDTANVRFEAAGTSFGAVSEAVTEGRVSAYRLELSDPARDALRRGLRAAATVSEEGGEPILELLFPLAGSSDGIARADALCTAVRQRSEAAPQPRDSVYDGDAIETELVDRDLTWAGAVTRLDPDGSASRREEGAEPVPGRWHLEGTDRICLTFDGTPTRCLRFYREGGALMVRRSDVGAEYSLGAVEVAAQ